MYKKRYRYPGVKPFTESESTLFFGRDNDIEQLIDLITTEKIVILFGKSGYGKSSLINAGILPILNKEAIPILVRFGSYEPNSIISLITIIKRKLDETLKDTQEGQFLDSTADSLRLWHFFKKKESNRDFILIFDQFEEFENYPLEERKKFKEQISELLSIQIPIYLRDRLDEMSQEHQRYIASSMNVRVVFTIRSDRMSLLDFFKDKIPTILNKRYEIKALTLLLAKEAIIKPSLISDPIFLSNSFTYSNKSLDIILTELSKTNSTQQHKVETFQLQILCSYIEEIVIKRNEINTIIHPTDLPDISKIYEEYYNEKVQQLKLPEQAQLEVQKLIEEGLLFVDEAKGEARRLSLDKDIILKQYKVTEILLQRLENTFMLRREENNLGGYNYEICHDTLISPILLSRKKREIEKEQSVFKAVNNFELILKEFLENGQGAIQLMLEDILISTDFYTGISKRIIVPEQQLINHNNISKKILKNLVDSSILRQNIDENEQLFYEISHDALLEPILRQKATRKARYEEERRLEAERLKNEAITQRREAEKQKLNAQIGAAISLFLLLICAVIVLWAWNQKNVAEKTLLDYKQELKRRKDLERNQFFQLSERAKIVIRDGAGLPRDIYRLMLDISIQYPNDTLIQTTLRQIEKEKPELRQK